MYHSYFIYNRCRINSCHEPIVKAKALVSKLTAGSINRCEQQLAAKAGKMRIVMNPEKKEKKDVKGNKKK